MSGKPFTREQVEQARSISLFEYLSQYDPGELIHVCGSTYTTLTHDSIRLYSDKRIWTQFSTGITRFNALDYLTTVRNFTFKEAVSELIGQDWNYDPQRAASNISEAKDDNSNTKEKKLLLPEKNSSNKNAVRYLLGRGIDEEIIFDCIDRNMIYENKYHSVVFVGFDNDGEAKYAGWRATSEAAKMKRGDCSGSNKEYCFRLKGLCDGEIHVFESAIDLLSFATITKLLGEDWRDVNGLALSGIYASRDPNKGFNVPKALRKTLEGSNIRKIILHLDNDEAGKNAAAGIENALIEQYEIVNDPPDTGKDFNDLLITMRKIYRENNREIASIFVNEDERKYAPEL